MKKNWKRLLSLALALVMVFGLMPVLETRASAVSDEYFYTFGAESGDFYDIWNVVRDISSDENVQVEIRLETDVILNPDMENDPDENIILYAEWDENIILDLNGHKIERKLTSAVKDGQIFYLMDESQLTVLNGTIRGAYNDGDGGAFYMDEDAQLTLTGVTVTDNTCSGNGFAIYAIDDTKVTINGGSEIVDNRGCYDEDDAGAAIYMDDDSSLTIENATVYDNDSYYGYAGAIYWGANGTCRLIDATIVDNLAFTTSGGVYVPAGYYDTDIFLGGKTVIENNKHANHYVTNNVNDYVTGNLYLDNDDADINNDRTKPLEEGAHIGITFGDIASEEDDILTAKDSMFTEASLSYFSYDETKESVENGYILRKVDRGTSAGNNRWALYATTPESSDYQVPNITAAQLRSEFASDVATVIDTENHTVTLTVKNDVNTKRFIRDAAIRDFVSFSYAAPGSQMLGDATVYNFVSKTTETYTVKTPNGTFEYWTIQVVPAGEWPEDPAVAAVNGEYFTTFDEAWGAVDAAEAEGDVELVLLADWLAGDTNNSSIIEHIETAGMFTGKLGSYTKGALDVTLPGTLTIDLNGFKIDRMRTKLDAVDNGGVIVLNSGHLVIKDSVGTGMITGGNTTGSGGGILVKAGTLTVDGSVFGNQANAGGGVYVTDGTLTVNGNVNKNRATVGGGVYMAGGTLTVNGSVSESSATTGGGIYVEKATATVNGEVCNNAASYGGGISFANGTLNLTGTVSGNVTTDAGGGGLYVTGGTVNINGATIEDNTAYSSGGGVYMTGGTVNMTDGYITANKATGFLLGGAGLYINNGTFNLSGGYINLNTTSAHGGGIAALNLANLNISGGSIIGNKGGQGGGVYWNATGTATLTGGSITSNTNGFWMARSDAGKIVLGGDIKIFDNARENLYLYDEKADLYQDTENPLTTGAKIYVCMSEGNIGNDDEDRFTASNGGFFEKSYEYFYADPTLPNYRIAHRENANATGEADRWQLYLVKTGSFADERATITAAKVADTYYLSEAEIDAEHNVITLHVNNDENGANKTAMEEMSLYELASFTFATAGAKIVGGEVQRNLVKNPIDLFVVKTPNGTYDYWTIRVIPNTPWGTDAVIARVYLEGEENYQEFTAGHPTEEDPNKGFSAAWQLALENPGSTFRLYADWHAGDTNSNGIIDTTETAGKFTGYGTYQGAIYLNDANIDVTVDLNGFAIDRCLTGSSSYGTVFWMKAGKLTVEDSHQNGTITGGNYHMGGAFLMDGSDAKLVINGGNISGNHAPSHGGAIYASMYASVTVNGGTISNNTAASDGGAIRVDNGASLTINGGTISGNKAVSGGAVYLYDGSFLMTGGTIEDNSAENGGGVYLFDDTFQFRDGVIQSNTASGHGGGVYIFNKARMISVGGRIQNNTAQGFGGGIAFENPNGMASQIENTFLVENKAIDGGGIALFRNSSAANNLTHTFRNVVLHGNTAANAGGGLYVDLYETQHLLVFDGNVLENMAPYGGGVFYTGGILSMNGTSVTNNTAANAGGGVFAADDDDVDLYVGGALVIDGNKQADGRASNLCLEGSGNDVLSMVTSPLTEGAKIGVCAGETGTDLISGSDAGFGIADGYYFYADESDTYDIGLVDAGIDANAANRYRIYLAEKDESGYDPAITAAELKYESFAGSGTFAAIDAENRVLTLTVNNTYKNIFSNLSLDTFVGITTTEDSLISEDVLKTLQNFVTSPSGIYQVIEEDDWGADGYDGWYNLWTIEVVPEGGAWSDVAGSVATVITPVTTEHFYDMEMAYVYALTHAAYPGGATLKLNQDWVSNDGEDFDYEEGTSGGRLCLDESAYNLTIDLNGFTIRRALTAAESSGQIFLLESGTLTIMDSSEAQTGKITGGKNTGNGGAFYVTGGHLILNSGSIAANTAENGGGVYVTGSAKFTMNGGKIRTNTSNGDDSDHGGGGVYLDGKAAFTMNGGEIIENYANMNGSGIYVEDTAVFTMNGGSICKNRAISAGDAAGGAIYGSKVGDGIAITINGGEIVSNEAPYGGGIYWGADDSAKLYLNGGSIVRNSSTTGVGGGVYVTDDAQAPYVGGTIRVVDNIQMEGSSAVLSNLYLEDSDAKLRQNTGNKLAAGAQIGVRFGYKTDNDYFSASDSFFDTASIEHFSADDPAYFVRMSLTGSGGNAYRLYLTKTGSGSAANSQAAIVGAGVKAEYASPIAPVFENNVALIPVNADLYLEMISGNLSMNDVLSGKLSVSTGASILDESPLAVPTDLTAGVDIKVKAADGITVMTWRVKVVPGSESGEWNKYQVTLNSAAFADGTADTYYPGETVSIQPVEGELTVFKAWDTVDVKNEMTTVDGVTSFVMPANDVVITGLYYTKIDTVELDLEVEPVTAFPATGSILANGTIEGIGNVIISWKLGEEEQTGLVDFDTTYVAEVLIDLNTEDDYFYTENPTATITVNGEPVEITCESDQETLTATLSIHTRKPKIVEPVTTYSVNSIHVPVTSPSDNEYIDLILDELNTKYTTIPVVTEDSEINTVKVVWTDWLSYTNNENEPPVVEMAGVVRAEDNMALDMTDYNVVALVYGKQIVMDPVVSIAVNPYDNKEAAVSFSCATVGATVRYSLDGSDPYESDRYFKVTEEGTTHTDYVSTPKGSRTKISVKAVAVMEGSIDSNVISVTETFHKPYNLFVNGDHVLRYTITDNDGLYTGESSTIVVTPMPNYWISSMDAGDYGSVTNSNIIVISNPTSYVTIDVVCKALIETIELEQLTLTPGEAFPVVNEVRDGYTVTVDWNTNDETVAYGATYTPTVIVEATSRIYPFAEGFTVTMGGEEVYVSDSTAKQQSFSLTMTTPKAKLSAVEVPADITIAQGDVLNLPLTVDVTVDGNAITAANVSWICADFDADVAGTYTFVGTLMLPENVEISEDATGFNGPAGDVKTIQITVTVEAQAQLDAPTADIKLEDITKTVGDETVTVQATIVELLSKASGATIYYTINSDDLLDAEGNLATDGEGNILAAAYDPAAPITLDIAGTYHINAVAVKENRIISEMAEFIVDVSARQYQTVSIYTSIDSVTKLVKTFEVLEGDTVSVDAAEILASFTCWYVTGITLTEEESAAQVLTFTMPANSVVLTATPADPVAPEAVFAGSNMKLGNDLSMNFFVQKTKVANAAYALITYKGVTTKLEKAKWAEDTTGAYYKIVHSDLAAKEMTMEITVQIFDAEGNALTEKKTDSIRDYAMRILKKNTSTATLKTALVDMLNYGAAAQTHFNYKTDDLANSQLTDEQKALATAAASMTDQRVKSDSYYGTSLSLEENIVLNFYFKSNMIGKTATVTYKDHYGIDQTFTVPAVKNGSYAQIVVDWLVVADANMLVSVTIGGETVTDSVASYCARMAEQLPLSEPLMKFATSAMVYFDAN